MTDVGGGREAPVGSTPYMGFVGPGPDGALTIVGNAALERARQSQLSGWHIRLRSELVPPAASAIAPPSVGAVQTNGSIKAGQSRPRLSASTPASLHSRPHISPLLKSPPIPSIRMHYPATPSSHQGHATPRTPPSQTGRHHHNGQLPTPGAPHMYTTALPGAPASGYMCLPPTPYIPTVPLPLQHSGSEHT